VVAEAVAAAWAVLAVLVAAARKVQTLVVQEQVDKVLRVVRQLQAAAAVAAQVLLAHPLQA
jgi:hypothetical protein